MKVYRPVRSNNLNQGFGDNMPYVKLGSDGKPVRPFVVRTFRGKAPAGYTKFYPTIGLKGHNGYDNMTWHGEPLYFPVVCDTEVGWWSKNASDLDGGLGVDVISKKPVMVNGQNTYVKFRFWHLKEGYALDDVKPGDLIGLCDNTGASSGDHLHWSMKPCLKDGTSTQKSNGYYGAVDFTDYYHNEFIIDIIQVKERALTVIEEARRVIALAKQFIKSLKK